MLTQRIEGSPRVLTLGRPAASARRRLPFKCGIEPSRHLLHHCLRNACANHSIAGEFTIAGGEG